MLITSIIIFIVGMIITTMGLVMSAKNGNNVIQKLLRAIAFFAAVCFALAVLIPYGVPQYKVWQQQKEGEAELAKAEQNRQIAVQEAKAKEESAKSLANAEITRAQGVAQANKIIGDSLQNNDAYIHYLWIEALRESNNEVIYIPTEAGIPITESARFFNKKK